MTDQSLQGVQTDLLATGLQFHREGRLKEAEARYRQILQRAPDHFEALYWLGLIHLGNGDADQGIVLLSQALASRPESADAWVYLGHALNMRRRHEEALRSFDRALAINANLPAALNNRGLALHGLERFEEAVASFDKALALDPRSADALNNRGVTQLKLDRWEDALASFARALALRPSYPEALYNSGRSLRALGRHDEALASYDRALALKPNYSEALREKGLTLQSLRRHDEAVTSYQQALALKPDDPETFNNLGVALLKTKRYAEAMTCCDQAIALDPDYHVAFSNRSAVLLALGRHAEAFASQDRALALKPDFVDAMVNRGNTLQALRRHAEALEAYRRAAALKPKDPDTLYNESFANLILGNFRIGWEQYECRWTRNDAPPQRPHHGSKWLGEHAIAGKRLLLWAEQGFGDTLQFCRYVPILARKGIEVSLEVPSALKALMGTLEGIATLIADTEPPPAHDYHCPLLSLPLALGMNDVSDTPNQVPYLAPTPDKVQAWKQVIEDGSGFKVGIACSGNPKQVNDRNRSAPLRQFSPLLETGAAFYLLQTECRSEDAAFLSATPQIADLRRRLTDFTQTAAAIACMDLVIAVDTSVAHLAGALGKPVWILLSFSPDWRWMLERDDSPWYPSAKLFRQSEIGDWSPVIEKVRAALVEEIRAAARG